MAHSDSSVRLADLLAHREWVRDLALALTRDLNDADDVVQDTWLSALRSPPCADVPARGWLTSVVRNAARQRFRTDGRRTRRERVAARIEAVDEDPCRLVERAELQARVAAAVVALAEPYRRAVLLRHFEGLPVAEVARVTDVPLETARARLRRGRAQLRGRLAKELGDESPLSIALLPLLRPKWATAPSVATLAGGILMSKWLVGCITLVLVALSAWWLTKPGGSAETLDSTSSSAVPDGSAIGAHLESDARRRRERVEVREEVANAAFVDARTSAPAGQAHAIAPQESPTLQERLDASLTPAAFMDRSLREILGQLSDLLDVPLHAQADVRAVLDKRSSVTFAINSPISGQRAFESLLPSCGLAYDVETDRLVLRLRDAAVTTAGTPTFQIVPVPHDSDAPSTVTIRARVLLPDGSPAVGARIVGIDAPRDAADVAGAVCYESMYRDVRLRAELPFHERSSVWSGRGEFGGVLRPELILGPPAGAVDVTVTSGGTSLPGATVSIDWAPTGGSPRASRSSPVALVTNNDGFASDDHVAAARDVSILAHAPGHTGIERVVRVTAGDRLAVAIDLERESLEERLRGLRTTLRFEGARPSDVIRYLADSHRLNIILDPATRRELDDREVSLNLSDVTVEEALGELCDAVGRLRFTVNERSRVVLIKSAEN